jgi:hypothetical protein
MLVAGVTTDCLGLACRASALPFSQPNDSVLRVDDTLDLRGQGLEGAALLFLEFVSVIDAAHTADDVAQRRSAWSGSTPARDTSDRAVRRRSRVVHRGSGLASESCLRSSVARYGGSSPPCTPADFYARASPVLPRS